MDNTPGVSGFEIGAISDLKYSSLVGWLLANPNNGTFLTGHNPVVAAAAAFAGSDLNWQKFTPDTVGFVPSGTVVYTISNNGHHVYVVNNSADDGILSGILSTFRFTK
ncbi:MAG TPA: hypothetical protein VF828_02815 [Patescibacteria group bacterium]